MVVAATHMSKPLDILDDCLDVLQSLRSGHSPALPSPTCEQPRLALDLRHISSLSFGAALRRRPIATDVFEALMRVYNRMLGQLKQMYIDHFSDVQRRWGTSRPLALPQVQRLFITQCQIAAQDMHDSILACVDERLKTFAVDAHAAPEVQRGHSAQAVSILERAFQYAPNITQAEKYRLAQATGLQPRQVTIWVRTQIYTLTAVSKPT